MNTTELFQKILQIPSYSHEEEELAEFIYKYAEENNLPVEKQDGNVLISFRTGSSKCLIFNAHMDTVRAGNRSHWKYPPVGLDAGVVKGNTIYGLGASDMKATIVSFLELARDYGKTPPPIDLIFCFVTREEVDGYGSKVFVDYFCRHYKDRYKTVAAIAGEPTDLEYLEVGHRGTAFARLTTRGDSGHGSRPENIKVHAVFEMLALVKDLKEYFKKIQGDYQDSLLGKPSFALTGISTPDSSPNKVPPECYALWDIRTTPALHDKLEAVLKEGIAGRAELSFLKAPLRHSYTDPKERIVTALKEVMPDLEIRVARGANDTCMFTAQGIPAITFGPGIKACIHKENEYAPLSNIPKAVKAYKEVVGVF